MLIDLGNSDAMWLFPNRIPNFNYNRPNIDDFLEEDLMETSMENAVESTLKLGNNILNEPIVAMPSEESVKSMNFVKERIGSIGADVLKRFTIGFDYKNGLFFIKKNKSIKEPFRFNMSGLDIKHDGMKWEKDLVKVELPKLPESTNNDRGTTIRIQDASEFQYKFVLKPEYSVAGVREKLTGIFSRHQKRRQTYRNQW